MIEKRYIPGIDWLKLGGAFTVVAYHLKITNAVSFNLDPRIASIFRVVVPLFFMIAGYLNRYKPNIWQGTATMLYRACLNAKEPIKHFPSIIFSTGEALSSHVMKELEKYKNASVLISTYGTTESGGIAFVFYRFNHPTLAMRIIVSIVKRLGFIKKIYNLNDFKDIDDDYVLGNIVDNAEVIFWDEELKATVEVGEICAKTDGAMQGYTSGTEKKAYITYNGNRYIRTGDIGYLKNNMLFLSGRKKNMIIRSGENILPSEIERVIESCHGVVDVVVCGVPDKDYGEAICACIEPDEEGFELENVKNAIREKLPKYMFPQYFEIVDEIPMNASGKKDVRKMRERIIKN